MSSGTRVDVDIAVPVYNEHAVLAESVTRLHDFLSSEFPFSWRMVIVDNASTDDTGRIAEALAQRLPGVSYLCLEQKGRGRALRAAWSSSDARVVAYMDIDLSTDLRALSSLVAPVLAGHSEAAIGSRLARGSRVVRGIKREFISRMYNHVLRIALHARFSDAQCGFKAFRSDVALELLELCEDQEWFFDTEMLMLCQRRGYRIHEVPVDWVDDEDSRVNITSTALKDLRGVLRLVFHQRHPESSRRPQAQRASRTASRA